jgi:predicted amidophosphoribosyltransferase
MNVLKVSVLMAKKKMNDSKTNNDCNSFQKHLPAFCEECGNPVEVCDCEYNGWIRLL